MLPKLFSGAKGGDNQSVGSERSAIPPPNDDGWAEAITGQEAVPATSATKMALAEDVFRRMNRKKGVTRREIVAAFIEEAGLTKAGAATYYQIIKKGRR